MDNQLPLEFKIPDNLKLLLEAPKVLRTHHWIMKPSSYGMACPLEHNHKITWSEYESHIWCYHCSRDWYVTINNAGVFSGPIPITLAAILGIRFERVEISTQKVIDVHDPEFDNTWVSDPELDKWLLDNKLTLREVPYSGEKNEHPSES